VTRGAYSILSSLGLPELVAETPAAYVDINLRLARDHAWRSRLRSSLRERLVGSPLMDADTFVADLESCYRGMWRSWCATVNAAQDETPIPRA
jgi:predicted O-linked N-acetylglucosamine transferase (SPINDLY family)